MPRSSTFTVPAPPLDVHGAFMPRSDWSGASLEDANLSHADASGASFRNVDFKNARLVGAILRAADLTGALNLTEEQLATALIDEETKLPEYIDRARVMELASQRTERRVKVSS